MRRGKKARAKEHAEKRARQAKRELEHHPLDMPPLPVLDELIGAMDMRGKRHVDVVRLMTFEERLSNPGASRAEQPAKAQGEAVPEDLGPASEPSE